MSTVLPELMARAPEWTRILHCRIWNDESARVLYAEILLDQDLEVGKIVESFTRGNYGRKSSDMDISIVGNALSAIAALSGKTKDVR